MGGIRQYHMPVRDVARAAPLLAIVLGCSARRGHIDSTTSRQRLLTESPRVLSNKRLTASPTHCSHALPLPHQHSVAAQSVRPFPPAGRVSPAQSLARRDPNSSTPPPVAGAPTYSQCRRHDDTTASQDPLLRPALACGLEPSGLPHLRPLDWIVLSLSQV